VEPARGLVQKRDGLSSQRCSIITRKDGTNRRRTLPPLSIPSGAAQFDFSASENILQNPYSSYALDQ
jgi:hypothetical protein